MRRFRDDAPEGLVESGNLGGFESNALVEADASQGAGPGGPQGSFGPRRKGEAQLRRVLVIRIVPAGQGRKQVVEGILQMVTRESPASFESAARACRAKVDGITKSSNVKWERFRNMSC